jgi:hypothetical protein
MEDNIKMGPREIGWKSVDWIYTISREHGNKHSGLG